MSKRFAFIQSIALLHIFEVWGQFCAEEIDKERIIGRYFKSSRIDLSELYKLNDSDQACVVDELASQCLCHQKQLPIVFILRPPCFTRVPDCFQRLCGLKSIRISVELSQYSYDLSPRSSQKGVDEFVESIFRLQNVHKLYLGRMKLVECPAGVCNLKLLEHLDIEWNNLNSGSFDEVQLPNLKELSICGNVNLEDFPEGVLNFTKLKRLSLICCSLRRIPPSISRLENLKMLDLLCNRFESFPREVHSLKSLEGLFMDGIGLMKSAEIDLGLSPHLRKIELSCCFSLGEVVLNIPEKCLIIEMLDISRSPVMELLVSPNLAFSKINCFKFDLPQRLPPSYGDQLGWPEVIELCESRFEGTGHCISGERRVLDRCSLSEFNRFYWKQGVLEQCVLDFDKDCLDRDEILRLWNMIVEMVEIGTSGTIKSNHECSLIYLRNLYGESAEDPGSIIKFTYVQYKPSLKALLPALFKKINNSRFDRSMLKVYVESILEMFQRQRGEQLVYFYHLLKSLSKRKRDEVRFEDFIQNSIAILKDYIFTMTVNLKGCDQGLLDECKTRAKNLGLMPDNEVVNFDKDDEYYKSEMLPLFYYKFSPDWLCKTVAEAINFDEELRGQALWYISESAEDPTICYKHGDVAGSKFPEKIKGEGVNAILMRMGLIGCN